MFADRVAEKGFPHSSPEEKEVERRQRGLGQLLRVDQDTKSTAKPCETIITNESYLHCADQTLDPNAPWHCQGGLS